ncbi:MAG: hypothetical protein ACOZAO_01565 [Patescibacteria group bacterium]
MPKFFYTVVLLTAGLWIVLARILAIHPPENNKIIATVLALIFVTMSFTISIAIYIFKHKKAPQYSNLRKIYRKSFIWAAFISLGITALFAFRAFSIVNSLNIVLFILLYFSIYAYIKSLR